MDIDLSFIENDYFSSSITNYLESLFKSGLNIIGIVLFGSISKNQAVYSPEKISDIDLLVIFDDEQLPNNHRTRTNLKIKKMGFTLSGIDSIWMSKSEFNASIENKRDLILSILDDGIILYDCEYFVENSKNNLFKELQEKGVKKRKMYWIWPQEHPGEEIEW